MQQLHSGPKYYRFKYLIAIQNVPLENHVTLPSTKFGHGELIFHLLLTQTTVHYVCAMPFTACYQDCTKILFVANTIDIQK